MFDENRQKNKEEAGKEEEQLTGKEKLYKKRQKKPRTEEVEQKKSMGLQKIEKNKKQNRKREV